MDDELNARLFYIQFCGGNQWQFKHLGNLLWNLHFFEMIIVEFLKTCYIILYKNNPL